MILVNFDFDFYFRAEKRKQAMFRMFTVQDNCFACLSSISEKIFPFYIFFR